jgi:hypothetical protein
MNDRKFRVQSSLFRSLWSNMLVVYEVAVRYGLVRSVGKKYVVWFGSVRFGSANPRFGRPLVPLLCLRPSLSANFIIGSVYVISCHFMSFDFSDQLSI